MRLSPSYYPEYIDLYCRHCNVDSLDVKVDSIEGEDVVVLCPVCDEVTLIRVID